MNGASGTYAFNNVDLTLQPTGGKWRERSDYGMDGGGHPVYSQVRSFELSWDLISTNDAAQIINAYNAVGNTGTVVSCLPEWGNVNYEFKNYSGTTLEDPTVGEYFIGHINDLKITIFNIRTNQ
jgi:hypothetical protein